MPQVVLLIRGDMLGQTPYQPVNHNNPNDPDFGMEVSSAMRLGPPDSVFRLVGVQVDAGAESFYNGQFWRLESYSGPADPSETDLNDPANWTLLYDGMAPKPDLVAGLGMTPNGVVFEVQGVGYDPNDDFPGTPWGRRHVILDVNAEFPETAGPVVILPPRDENGNIIEGPLTFDTIRDAQQVPCFVRGTLILTPEGPRAVETLLVGDLIVTRDHGSQPIRWIGTRRLSPLELAAYARLRPVRIAAGALGPGLPEADLLVSPQHRMLVRSRIAGRMTGNEETLIAARHLLELEGVSLDSDRAGVEYFHIMFDRHEVIIANGAETESFYPGTQALRAIDMATRDELFELFPELRNSAATPVEARAFLSGHKARKLVQRHRRNGQPITAAA